MHEQTAFTERQARAVLSKRKNRRSKSAPTLGSAAAAAGGDDAEAAAGSLMSLDSEAMHQSRN